jgi:hypothetical protein
MKDPEKGTTEWIVRQHHAAEMAFHVAFKSLVEEKGLTEEIALALLHPPLEEGEKGFHPGPMPDEGKLKEWMTDGTN